MPETVTLAISKLKLMPRNPRRITQDQLAKLSASLLADPELLERRPILVNMTDSKYIVYAGNMRVRAAKKAGLRFVPCIVDIDLDPDIMRKRIILDNVSFGSFDFDILAQDYEIGELIELGITESALHINVDDIIQDAELTNDKEKCTQCGQTIRAKK